MKNVMTFDGGYKAVIAYDPEIDMFRGEFVGLNGGADFYAKDAQGLKKEGRASLDTFMTVCREQGITHKKQTSNFALRLDAALYNDIRLAATAAGRSVNQYITERLRQDLSTGIS